MPSAPIRQPAGPAYRADIDGLRAIAVIMVVGFHAFPTWFPGGFIGVDIFFVISGFLISTIIFQGLERGRFSFLDFYSRRIRRIFPTLLTVLACTFVFGWFALNPDEYKRLGKHVAAGAGFVSNLVAQRDSGYFDVGAHATPLLHLWSLGIEEQFYIVFPVAICLAWRRRDIVGPLLAGVALASFAINLATLGTHPAFAFYSPITRGWELMLGAILAHGSLCDTALPSFLKSTWDRCPRSAPSIAGLLLIALGLLLIDKDSRFPGWWALLPTTGAVLLIASGPGAWVNRRILSDRTLVGIGLISYPIYLWHWVLLAFPYIMNDGEPSPAARVVSVTLCVALAWATYRLIERPLRHGGSGNLKTWGLAAAAMLTAAIGLTTQYSDIVTSQQVRSLGAKQLENHRQFNWQWNSTPQCVRRFGTEFEQYCQIADASKDPEILLIGDSNGNHLIYGFDTVNPAQHALMLGRPACPPLLGVTTRIAEGESDCGPTMTKAIDLATTMPSVKTIVLSMMGPGYINGRRSLVSGSFLDIHGIAASRDKGRAEVFAEGLRRTLSALSATTKQVIFVVSTPRLDFQPRSCIDDRPLRLSPKLLKSPCAMPRTAFEQDSNEYRRLVRDVLSEFPKVKVFDAADALCDSAYCHAMKEGRLLYRDDLHLSIDGSVYLARKIAEAYPLN